MKKLLLGVSIIALGLISKANAQIQKGNWMVGSSLIASNFGLNEGSGYNISLQPRGLYFIKNNLALGGYVDLGINKVTKESSTRFNYGVGAIGRYYLSPSEGGVDNLLKHGRWFMEGNVGVGGNSAKNSTSTTGIDFGVGPGYAYFITPNIGLDGMIKYVGKTGFGNTGLSSNLTFNLGFNIYLPTSKVKQVEKDLK